MSSTMDDGRVSAARKLVPAGTVLRRGEAFPVPRHFQEVVIFLPFVLAGFVLLFSPFLVAALE